MLFVVPTPFHAFRLSLFVTFCKSTTFILDFLLLEEIRYEQNFKWYESDEMSSTLGHLNIGGLEEPK